jgi:hypothetical protein
MGTTFRCNRNLEENQTFAARRTLLSSQEGQTAHLMQPPCKAEHQAEQLPCTALCVFGTAEQQWSEQRPRSSPVDSTQETAESMSGVSLAKM